MRLQKYIAKSGLTSRRKAEKLIEDGEIFVNGRLVNELGSKVEVGIDKVTYRGKLLELEEEKIYIALNKPVGYVTTLSDEFNRPIVMDLIKSIEERIYPVGRLDIDTSGLLLLTNDGELANRLTHPSYEIKKTYLAEVEGFVKEDERERMSKGLEIENYITAAADVKVRARKPKTTVLEISIHEGRNRQVRKMCSAIGHEVVNLERISFAGIGLGKLEPGSWKHLSLDELERLKGQ